MKIAFFEANKGEEEFFRKELKGQKLAFYREKLNGKNIDDIKDYEILVLFINSKVGKKELQKLPKLKYIATTTTGFDHIDIKSCKNRGVAVSNVPYYGENTVAEHTMALLLAMAKKIYKAIEKTKNDDFSFSGLEGFDLKGKTLGVVGCGHIGMHVIKYAKAFDMEIISYDPTPDKKIAKNLGFRFVSLNELLKNSDVITIHARLTESSLHLINMKNIKLVKRGAYLINTARGAIIDTRALKYALDHGIIAGAALDVLEGEEDIKEETDMLKREIKKEEFENFIRNHLLLKSDKVIVTPHSAFYTKEAVQRIMDTTLDNLQSFLRGKAKNRVV